MREHKKLKSSSPIPPSSSSTIATNNDHSYDPNVKMPMIAMDDDNDNDSFSPLDAISDFMRIAEVIMNRRPRRDDGIWTLTKFWLFREFFRTTVCPKGRCPEHLLWTLHFLKVYPKQGPGCSTVGASNGAIDPKMHRKWV
jgi:hypothetical protein